MTLLDIIRNINTFSEEDTIYALEPWIISSQAIVTHDENGKLPEKAKEYGMSYFLEIIIIKELLEDWQSSTKQNISPEEKCDRIIQYALNDV